MLQQALHASVILDVFTSKAEYFTLTKQEKLTKAESKINDRLS